MAWAAVQTDKRRLELREFDLPEIGADDALLRVEACGICGTDYEQFNGDFRAPYPVVPGHEPVGIIAEIGEAAARRWGVMQGDRVAVEPILPCGRCVRWSGDSPIPFGRSIGKMACRIIEPSALA